MRGSWLLVLGLTVLVAGQEPAASAETPAFAGVFTGTIAGTAATLVLERHGDALKGQIDASGYLYLLSGTVGGQQAQGTLSDPQAGGAVAFRATLDGDRLHLTLHDAASGQQVAITLTRGPATATPPEAPAAPAPTTGERDPALVGRWAKQEAMSGGGASLAMQTFLTVSADGTFSYGSARAVGGGETPWGTWGVDTGTGGDTMSGRWRTADRILYLLHPTTGQWVPAARYYVEGNQLLLYLPDGSRELWYRQP